MKLIGVIENLADISFQEWDHHQGEMLIGVASGRWKGCLWDRSSESKLTGAASGERGSRRYSYEHFQGWPKG
jgi:hypothetical protein